MQNQNNANADPRRVLRPNPPRIDNAGLVRPDVDQVENLIREISAQHFIPGSE